MVGVNAKDERDRTALHIAVLKGQEEIVKLLLTAKHIDIDSKDSQGRTVLMNSVIGGTVSCVVTLQP